MLRKSGHLENIQKMYWNNCIPKYFDPFTNICQQNEYRLNSSLETYYVDIMLNSWTAFFSSLSLPFLFFCRKIDGAGIPFLSVSATHNIWNAEQVTKSYNHIENVWQRLILKRRLRVSWQWLQWPSNCKSWYNIKAIIALPCYNILSARLPGDWDIIWVMWPQILVK